MFTMFTLGGDNNLGLYTDRHTERWTHTMTERMTNLTISSNVYYVHTWRR